LFDFLPILRALSLRASAIVNEKASFLQLTVW